MPLLHLLLALLHLLLLGLIGLLARLLLRELLMFLLLALLQFLTFLILLLEEFLLLLLIFLVCLGVAGIRRCWPMNFWQFSRMHGVRGPIGSAWAGRRVSIASPRRWCVVSPCASSHHVLARELARPPGCRNWGSPAIIRSVQLTILARALHMLRLR